VLLLLTHLLIFVPYSFRSKVAIISASFTLALVNESAGWLVRFVDPAFSVLKVAGFLGFQCILAFLLGALALFLLRNKQAGNKGASHGNGKTPQNDQSRSGKTGNVQAQTAIG